jgi:hypothetical protein
MVRQATSAPITTSPPTRQSAGARSAWRASVSEATTPPPTTTASEAVSGTWRKPRTVRARALAIAPSGRTSTWRSGRSEAGTSRTASACPAAPNSSTPAPTARASSGTEWNAVVRRSPRSRASR